MFGCFQIIFSDFSTSQNQEVRNISGRVKNSKLITILWKGKKNGLRLGWRVLLLIVYLNGFCCNYSSFF